MKTPADQIQRALVLSVDEDHDPVVVDQFIAVAAVGALVYVHGIESGTAGFAVNGVY